MKLDCAGSPELTYCTNIHPGETWCEVRENLVTYVRAVKRAVSPSAPFGVGLRLSAAAARELDNPEEVAALRAFLQREGLYVFTLNGFPYGSFHGGGVKEQVYLPDWRDDERLVYTNRLARLLAQLLPHGCEGSISTVPGAFKGSVASRADEGRIADQLIEHAGGLARLADLTGAHVALALEPEPFCHLETVEETIAFFEREIWGRLETFSLISGLSGDRAEEALRSHLGVCVDACHLAVGFEEVDETLGALTRAGIRIPKLQLSAGLEIRPSDRPLAEMLSALRPFAEDVYLHQATELQELADGRTMKRRFLDLPAAIDDIAGRERLEHVWRVHFHVPLFSESLGPFHGTQAHLSALLERLRAHAHSPHLEIETYTWEVLPPEHRSESVVSAIAREIQWARSRLETAS